MKTCLSVLLILIAHCSTAQYKQDTTISKKALDSVLQQLASYKDGIKQRNLSSFISEKTFSIDTLYSAGKDTLTISNRDKNKRLLMTQVFYTDKAGCKTWLHHSFYDTTTRLMYQEHWKLGCDTEKDITGFLQNRTRFHYDSLGHETGMTQEFWDCRGHTVRKYNYSIDVYGKKIWGDKIILNKYAFWD